MTIEPNHWRFVRFAVVGASGMVVNSLFLYIFTDLIHIHYLVSAALATQGSTLWNFVLSEIWVFDATSRAISRSLRLVSYFAMNNLLLLVRGPFLYALTTFLGVYYLISNLLVLVAMALFRYGLADNLIWRGKHEEE